MTTLQFLLFVSAVLFCVGLGAVLSRRNVIVALVGVELMMNAANLNFITFARLGPHPNPLEGWMFVIFSIAVAAAEAAVGLAIVIAIYRRLRTTHLDQMDSLKG